LSHEQKIDLQKLAVLYPVYEQHVLQTLPSFGTYTSSVDTTLITRYAEVITQVLTQKQVSAEDRNSIKRIAHLMTRGAVYRNASADSRWRNYAKQAIVHALQKSKDGAAILESLVADNPQLQSEIEAYTLCETELS
jgi:hypothetical protein